MQQHRLIERKAPSQQAKQKDRFAKACPSARYMEGGDQHVHRRLLQLAITVGSKIVATVPRVPCVIRAFDAQRASHERHSPKRIRRKRKEEARTFDPCTPLGLPQTKGFD